MKRFWLVLLSLGLVMAFSASAFAVDVKVSGSYVAAGVYLDQVNLQENVPLNASHNDQSTAFYFQRLRVGTELVVSPGLSVITRFDALERVFGGVRTAPDTALQPGSAGTWAENENMAWDYAYVKYAAPIGTFQVGAQPGGTFGTVFANSEEPRYRIKYTSLDYSGFIWGATIEKNTDNSFTSRYASENEDADQDTYYLTFDYKKQSWAVGLLYGYTVDNRYRDAEDVQGKYHTFNPYATATFGPVKLQAELKWIYGKYDAENTGSDSDVNSFGGWIDAVATFGPVYVGGTFAYAEGDVDDNNDKFTGAVNGGRDWSPTLIMWNEDRARWVGALRSTAVPTAPNTFVSDSGFGETFQNAWLGQVRVGVKPVEKLDVCFAVTYAKRDRVINDTYDKDLGWEFDLTGTYKITNNLSYMLGAGYLITGDYFKGANQASEVENDYMIINKLALTF